MRSAVSWPFGSILSLGFWISTLLAPCAWAQNPAPGSSAAPPAASGSSPAPQQAAPSPPGNPDSQNPPGAQESITAEPSGNDQGGMFVFKKQVEEVVLHATVYDEGIVVDNSGSMRDKREKVNQAVLNLIRASNPKDEIFVVNFSQKYYLDQDFTGDVNLLQAALHQVSAKGSTALYDAIVASAVHLKNNPRLEKKVLLVITDGQDNMSQETLQEAARRLQQSNGPTLYAVGLLGSGMQSSGRDALQHLAAGTGGVAYFPDTLDQVDNITRTVAHDIRSQYMLAYKPHNQNVKPGYQSVRVEAHAPGYGKLTVRTRSGYFPPEGAH